MDLSTTRSGGSPVTVRGLLRRVHGPGRPYLSWIALSCSGLLTWLAWSVSSRSLDARLRDQFVQRSQQIVTTLARRIEEHETVLRGGVALFLASDVVTRSEFHDYFRHLELSQHFPGILGIGYALLLRGDEVPGLEARIRAEGYPSFEVQPAGTHSWLTPIVLIEPFSGPNLRAFGFDMFSERTRRAAIERAWHTGRASVSAIVRLVQDTPRDTQPGLLIYLPVYRTLDTSPWEPRRTPAGFVYSPLRTHDLVRGTLGPNPDDLDFALYDEGERKPFYDTRVGAALAAEQTHECELELPGRTWRVRFWTRPNFEKWISRAEPRLVLVAGIVINLLLFWALSVSASLRTRAQALAAQMTRELTLAHGREQKHMLASLREKETLLKEIHHRVKNNLQVVSSLLSLQRSHVQDERALEPLRQSQGRVLTMAALHEFLYRSDELSHVDTRAYLTHVVSMLSESYASADHVIVTLELDDVPLDVDRAIPCGLITNELVSNAFKYAFAERGGKLFVSFRRELGEAVLCVHDDGPGLASARELEQPATLGLHLVQLLTQQLAGALAHDSRHGARFELRFPFPQGTSS
ncbi:MAG TPA: CHASE domain-containing protein [Polyangiales bacterium]|nr:CHASE domain-containing protein [Polyangiales bacterium]